MNIHEFSVIKMARKGYEQFFTGRFRRRKFPWLCKLFGMKVVVPAFSDDMREAEFHLSPSETHESIAHLRMRFPEYQWFYDTAILHEYKNIAMEPRFIVIVKHKTKKYWRYYVDGAYRYNEKLSVSALLADSHFCNIDEAKIVCNALNINHKDYNYMTLPTPTRDVHGDCLAKYIEENPPRPIYMTFSLKNE